MAPKKIAGKARRSPAKKRENDDSAEGPSSSDDVEMDAEGSTLGKRAKTDPTQSAPAETHAAAPKKKVVVSAKAADSGFVQETFKPIIRNDGTDPNNPARVYMDGIFDCFHFGHARALQQGKHAFPYVTLVVGCCNDEITHRLKGKTVMTERERYEGLRHCKWVDEVVEDAPWLVTQDFIDKHKIDYIAHGEDLSLDEFGNDVYAFAKAQGRFTTIKRTEGISTSDLVLRIVRNFDEYALRSLNRGYTRDDLNISLLTETRLRASEKAHEIQHDVVEKVHEIFGGNDDAPAEE